MTYFDPGYGEHVVVDGNIVERQALYLVEKIKDYDPNIEVLCVDPNMAGPFEEPFQICERVGDQVYKIFGCWELNDSVLERIYLCDTKRIDVLGAMEKHNQQVRAEQQRRYKEKREAAKDIVEHAIRAFEDRDKSHYSFTRESDGANVTLFDDRPAEVTYAD